MVPNYYDDTIITVETISKINKSVFTVPTLLKKNTGRTFIKVSSFIKETTLKPSQR